MFATLIKGACLSGVCALAMSAAHAQDVTASAANSPRTDPDVPVQAEPAPKPLPSTKAPSFQPLADEGITLALSYTGEAAGNVSGGLKREAAYAGQVYVGADFDMDRIAGIKGATIHGAITNRHGDSLSELALGNNTSVQEIWGTQNTHLAILTWEQKLLNDRLTIEAGRSQANIHFLKSPLYCNFQSNSACGNPTFVFKDSNFTYFPASSWMIQATGQITPHVFAHVGAYEVNPDRKRASDHGFNFSVKNATGVIVPWEVGYVTTPEETRYPGHYILGGWVDKGDYSDPLRDDQGGIALLTGRDAKTDNGRTGIYFRFDRMLTRPDPRTLRGLSVFGVAMTNLSGRVEESRFFDMGLVQTGTFAGRDADTLGFMISDQRFSDLAMTRMRAAELAAGGDGKVDRHQYMMELSYGAQLNSAIRISPNIQYIANPDRSGAPERAQETKNALIFGFKFTVDALGLAAMR